MNIILLTRSNPHDINTWSGTLWHVYAKLKERHNIRVMGTEILGQLAFFSKDNYQFKLFTPVERYLTKISKLLSERINNLENYDLVFFGDLYFIPYEITIPYVVFSDMTFEQVRNHYKIAKTTNINTCIDIERSLLNYAFKIIYPSEWIKKKAMEFYDLNPNKIDVVEFGANIMTPANYSIELNMDICRLVFIGKDWERKGGVKMIDIYKILKNDDFPCTLTIIGSDKHEIDSDDCNLMIYNNLDKTKPSDMEEFQKILSTSHFLVLPTKFDAFGIVFCEASAYAIPSITANVGGIGQVVINGKNGYLLPADATANDYADKIKTVFNDRDGYIKLRKSSRHEFETRLNWDVWGEKINQILEDTVANWKLQNNKTINI